MFFKIFMTIKWNSKKIKGRIFSISHKSRINFLLERNHDESLVSRTKVWRGGWKFGEEDESLERRMKVWRGGWKFGEEDESLERRMKVWRVGWKFGEEDESLESRTKVWDPTKLDGSFSNLIVILMIKL